MSADQGVQMLAFHGNQEIKAFYLDRVRRHRANDEIIHGKYWENGKGCAVGCCIHSGRHIEYETELGIPIMLARLEDRLWYLNSWKSVAGSNPAPAGV